MRALSIVAALTLLVTAGAVEAGTGAGNEFKHHRNAAFDFHVASPKDWPCTGGCDAATPVPERGQDDEAWLIEAPERTTWLRITFLSDFPAENEAELLREIERRYPDDRWQRFGRGSFLGFTNSPQGDRANAATEYYLVAKRQVIRISWQKDGAMPQRALELNTVKQSIDRVSEPPRINFIRSERSGAGAVYKPGDSACLLIEVDDLRSAWTDQSVRTLALKGVPEHWSFKSIDWVAASNWFKVCYRVNASMVGDALMPTELLIEDDDGRGLSCRPPEGGSNSDGLECRSHQDTYRAPPRQVLKPEVALVENPSPDREGPRVQALRFDAEKLTLAIDASDKSGVYLAEVQLNDGRQVIYTDELKAATPVSLAPLVYRGWNTLDQIVLYDVNGTPSLYRRKRTQRVDEFYEYVPWQGTPSPSDIPVVSFLHGGRVR